MRRGLVVGGAFALIVAAGLAAVWPFWTARQIESAATANDGDRLEPYLDQAAIATDMKHRVNAELLADEDMSALAIALTDRAVEAAASPYGMARLIANGLYQVDAAAFDVTAQRFTYRAGYVSPNRFRIRTFDPKAKADGPSFLLGRQNLVQWKIIKVEPAGRTPVAGNGQ